MSDYVLHTRCDDCVFMSQTTPYGQLGCHAGMIDKFKAAKVPMQWVLGESGIECWEINRVCQMKRNDNWVHHNSDKSPVELVDIAREEANFPVEFIILCETNYDDLEDSLSLIDIQNPQPKALTVILNNNKLSLSKTMSLLDGFNFKFPYKVKKNQLEDRERGDLIHEVITQSNKMFTAFFYAGYQINGAFTKTLNNAYNEKMKVFNLVLPNDDQWNGLVVEKNTWMIGNDFNWMENDLAFEVMQFDPIARIQRLAAEANFSDNIVKFEDI